MLKPLLQMYPVVIGFFSSARTATIRPPATSTRMPQFWLQSTQMVASAVLGVGHALEDAVLHELLEPVRQAMARGAEVGLEVVEPADAEEGVAQDEERPAVAHDGEGAGHGAGQVADVLPAHWGYRFQNGTLSQGGGDG